MAIFAARVLANGISTDHPIPGLPFVDDSLLPRDPAGIEAIGRKPGGNTWGRYDKIDDGGWVAFTTDPDQTELAWHVRFHPLHGRSVMLIRDSDKSSQHLSSGFELKPALLSRAGGYWWDGKDWYRPAQIWDGAAEAWIRRRVPGATTVFAVDAIDAAADSGRGRLLTVSDIDPADRTVVANWADHLAMWVSRRPASSLPLQECVVGLTAPELAADRLRGLPMMADAAGLAASTLRAYVARGEADVPEPQATVAGRSAWSEPVIAEWIEERSRSSESVLESMSVDRSGIRLPVGVADLWSRMTAGIHSRLWNAPDARQRWALRFRTEQKVREMAESVAWVTAGNLNGIVPLENLAITVQYALLHELAQWGAPQQPGDPEPPTWEFAGVLPNVAKMLDWLVRHDPARAHRVILEFIGDAVRQGYARHVAVNTITTALALDSALGEKAIDSYLQRALPAEK